MGEPLFQNKDSFYTEAGFHLIKLEGGGSKREAFFPNTPPSI